MFIAGRGLACALGNTLSESASRLAADPIRSTSASPFFAINGEAPADFAGWSARARQLVVNVVLEAGGETIRHAPMFIASSSLNMGAIERGQKRRPDMHAEAEAIAAWLDWQGPVYWVSTACTSSLNALLGASRMMRAGVCDDALVLGVELANGYTRSGFASMQLLSPAAALPLGAHRDGLVLGEAVAALRLSKNPSRWAVLGGANVVDGRDATGASREAVVQCWQEALETSGLVAPDNRIDLVKLQAAGSPSNDAIELDAIDAVFPRAPALISLKAHIGHTLGASGAAEIALLTAALEAGIWPACHHEQEANLPHALNQAAPPRSARVLASIIGFGGSHSCCVLQDTNLDAETPAPCIAPVPDTWEICGRSGPVLPDNWRDALADMLGQRPRRIGAWAEAGLFGALQCMRDAGETGLPSNAILRISSLHGPMTAILKTLDTIVEDGMAMPVAFLQSQPGQLPAIIGQALQWQGDGRIANHRDPLALLGAACSEAGPAGMLIGWVEEGGDDLASSHWLRLRAGRAPGSAVFVSGTPADLQTCRYLRFSGSGLEIAR
jgi:3-oxoacyl-[acyl-carrier-protein] synthase-1